MPGLARAEVNLHAMTAGVAMLSLYAWLVSLKQLLAQHGAAALPLRLAVVTDRGKGSKEQGNLVVKEAVQAAMALWDAPFRWLNGSPSQPTSAWRPACHARCFPNYLVTSLGFIPCCSCIPPSPLLHQLAPCLTAPWAPLPFPPPPLPCRRPVVDGGYAGMLEASGHDLCDWLLSDGFEARLFTFFPCTDITPAVANQASRAPATAPCAAAVAAAAAAAVKPPNRVLACLPTCLGATLGLTPPPPLLPFLQAKSRDSVQSVCAMLDDADCAKEVRLAATPHVLPY